MHGLCPFICFDNMLLSFPYDRIYHSQIKQMLKLKYKKQFRKFIHNITLLI